MLALVLCGAATAQADAIASLKQFVASTRSAEADFTQTVVDRNGRVIQSASGTMQFVRPGKFRWAYRKPYEQLIVGDGKRFWLYDVDLNQVTVKKLDEALGSSPAALLSGSNEIERGFTLTDAGSRDRLTWLSAQPKSPDTSFESIRMGFDARAVLTVMELYDAFGHVTLLQFSNLKRNPALSPQLFQFEPPQGADVLGE